MLGAADSHEGGIQATGVTELSTGAHAKSANLIDAATVSGGQKLAGMVAAAVTPSADPMGISAKAQGPPGLGSTRTHRRRTLRKLAWMRMATTINETTLKLTQLMAPSAVTPRKDSQGDAFGPVTTTPRANNKQQQLATVGPRTQLQQSATIADAVASGIGEHHGMAKNETEHSTACMLCLTDAPILTRQQKQPDVVMSLSMVLQALQSIATKQQGTHVTTLQKKLAQEGHCPAAEDVEFAVDKLREKGYVVKNKSTIYLT